MKIINKFLDDKDYKIIAFQSIKKDFEYLYTKILKRATHHSGSKFPNQTKIHWSRDWEYPWAIINSEVKAGEKVLDCGCGGSPLLPFLAQYGCKAYGVDPFLFKMDSAVDYYIDLIKDYKKSIPSLVTKILKSKKKIIEVFYDSSRNIKGLSEFNISDQNLSLKRRIRIFIKKSPFFPTVKILKKHFLNIIYPKIFRLKKNNLKRFSKDPNKQGFNIAFYKDSLDNMHFSDNFFDKVYCISVIEHLPRVIALKGMKEMARVLKKDGFLVITIDFDGITTSKASYTSLIEASGLQLYGSSDFTIPDPKNVPGTYNVLGFVLKK